MPAVVSREHVYPLTCHVTIHIYSLLYYSVTQPLHMSSSHISQLVDNATSIHDALSVLQWHLTVVVYIDRYRTSGI